MQYDINREQTLIIYIWHLLYLWLAVISGHDNIPTQKKGGGGPDPLEPLDPPMEHPIGTGTRRVIKI